MKVLMIAPGCDGTDVGEAWSSHQWAERLSRVCELTVLTYRKRSRPSVVDQLPHAEVIEWLDLPIVGRWERMNSMAKPGYAPFYFRARSWIRKALRTGRSFDLVHQVAPLAIRYPSPAAGLEIPLVFGPLAGSLPSPQGFLQEPSRTPWYMRLRGLDQMRIQHDPWLRGSLEKAAVVIGVAPYVGELMQGLSIQRFEWMSETGVVELPEPGLRQTDPAVCRLLFVGRITRMKGVRDAIRAVAHATGERPLTLDIVGEGEDRVACEAEAAALGLGECVTFHGRVPREAVDEFYRRSDIFLFPSMREPSGNVVLEAMAHGLPLIVADRGGPGFAVKDDFGVRVAVTNPEDYATRLAAAIDQLSADPDRCRIMGERAREQVRAQHLWEVKAAHLYGLYEGVLESRSGGE